MNARDVKNLCLPLLPLLPGYAHKGAMLYETNNGLLRGVYFEDSGFDKEAFYVWAFFLPLYVPTTHISFTFGRRLGAGKRWKTAADLSNELKKAVQDEGLPFLTRAETPESFAYEIAGIVQTPSDPYVLQAKAYSFAKSGAVTAAADGLRQLIAVLDTMDATIAWTGEMRSRAQELCGLVSQDMPSATQRLNDWEAVSRKNLRLPD